MTTPRKTGWPEPALLQDDDRKLFRWFASKPDARMRVREAFCAETQGRGCDECLDASRRAIGLGPLHRIQPEDIEGAESTDPSYWPWFWIASFLAAVIVIGFTLLVMGTENLR